MEGRAPLLSERSEVRVRLADASDAPALPLIEAAAGERFRTVAGLEFVADHDPSFAPEILDPARAEGRVWVAESKDGLAGYALALDLDGQPHLEQISVLPDWSGRGVGRALIEAVVGWAAALGRSSVTLATFRDVPWNAPLYAHLGWTTLEEVEVAADPRLLAVRAEEAEHGLDPADRVFMRLAI
ncbi:MAG: GNAT family N-acetyltransferase [Aquihabitans sp.]